MLTFLVLLAVALSGALFIGTAIAQITILVLTIKQSKPRHRSEAKPRGKAATR